MELSTFKKKPTFPAVEFQDDCFNIPLRLLDIFLFYFICCIFSEPVLSLYSCGRAASSLHTIANTVSTRTHNFFFKISFNGLSIISLQSSSRGLSGILSWGNFEDDCCYPKLWLLVGAETQYTSQKPPDNPIFFIVSLVLLSFSSQLFVSCVFYTK